MIMVKVYDKYNSIAFQVVDIDNLEGTEISKKFRAKSSGAAASANPHARARRRVRHALRLAPPLRIIYPHARARRRVRHALRLAPSLRIIYPHARARRRVMPNGAALS